MNKRLFFAFYLLLLSVLSGYLFSKVSWIGRAGINVFYKEYSFFKVWWQGALVIFAVLMCLYIMHTLVHKYTSSKARLYHIGGIVIALAGIYLTYVDFRETLSHRWLGERFHLGAYCFWLGWLSIAIFFLTQPTTASGKKDVTIQ